MVDFGNAVAVVPATKSKDAPFIKASRRDDDDDVASREVVVVFTEGGEVLHGVKARAESGERIVRIVMKRIFYCYRNIVDMLMDQKEDKKYYDKLNNGSDKIFYCLFCAYRVSIEVRIQGVSLIAKTAMNTYEQAL